jgi:hypothetical protein
VRPTPFGLAFEHLARERFAAIADDANRDRFVLQEPVGRLLREIVPEDADADGLEAHVRMLHHAHRHWASGGWVYRVGEAALRRAAAGGPIGSRLPHPALYLQLPDLRVWGAPTAEGGGAPEPLDGMFVTETSEPGAIAVLGIFGMREGRPGFSAVGVEGRADADDPSAGESLIDAARDDGSAPFTPTLAGGAEAGIHSLANVGELLLLTCRLLAQLPATRDAGGEMRDATERMVDVS